MGDQRLHTLRTHVIVGFCLCSNILWLVVPHGSFAFPTMIRIIKHSYIGFAWLYATFILSWLTLHTLFGDQIWWLALLNVMAPYLFLPLFPLLIGSIYYRSPAVYAPMLSVTLTFLALYGQQFPFQRLPLHRVNEPALRVMSFNIWSGSRTAETAKVMGKSNWPDLVAIQELTPHMATVIAPLVSEHYPYYSLSFPAAQSGMGIYSRYPLHTLADSQLSDPGWQVQIVEVNVGDKLFVLYNVHPHATNVYLYLEQGLSLPTAVRSSYQNRLLFVQRLLADIHHRQAPVIVAGDFNSTEQSDVYKVLTTQLSDAYRDAGWGFGHTFPAYSASFREIPPIAKVASFIYTRAIHFVPSYYLNSFRLLRIDMILHSQDFRATSSRVSSAHGESDHLPVLATLQWAR